MIIEIDSIKGIPWKVKYAKKLLKSLELVLGSEMNRSNKIRVIMTWYYLDIDLAVFNWK